MIAPRNLTLGEEIYYAIDTNEYLNEIYEVLLKNYSIHVLKLEVNPTPSISTTHSVLRIYCQNLPVYQIQRNTKPGRKK